MANISYQHASNGSLLKQYAEKVYGIKSDEGANESDDEDEDIEAAIQKEVGSLQDKGKGKGASDRVLTEVRIKEECLLFMRCKAPIEPVEFSRRICQDAASVGHGGAKSRYLNRLTPVTVIVKATESGLEEGAKRVLAEHFKLKSTEPKKEAGSDGADNQSEAQVDEVEEKTKPATVKLLSPDNSCPLLTFCFPRSTQSGHPFAATVLSRERT